VAWIGGEDCTDFDEFLGREDRNDFEDFAARFRRPRNRQNPCNRTSKSEAISRRQHRDKNAA
jgi:hypothetical protein